MKRIAALVLFASLTACATTPSPQATVAASQVALTATGRVVLACYSVPSCANVAPKPQIRAAYDNAYMTVVAAQAVADAGGTPSMVAATAAIATLQALVSQLPPTS